MDIKDAREAGAKAFADGKKRAPSLNGTFVEACDASETPFSVLLIAYLRGWDRANLAAPIPGF
jgi:hypothetical protein